MVWGEERPDGPRRQSVVLKYFIFTHLGSLLVLAGLLILYNLAGRDSFSALRQGVEIPPGMVSTLTVLFLIGFGTKMAIFPLHVWLPDAHTIAPMPVTIMLAAAMLSMGTYGILRFPMSLFNQEQLAGFALPMMIVGGFSVIYGGLMALAERDIKRIIAYSSVSQMGYVLFGLGTLTHDGIVGATAHVIYHAIVKALLFIVAGQVIYATGRRYLNDLGGLLSASPAVAASAVIGVLAIAGTPPLCEFDSEWMIFSGGFQTDHIGITVITLLGSLLTVAYAFWFGGRVFFGSRPPDLEVNPLPLTMVVPGVLLAILTIVAGIFPASVFAWAEHEFSLLLGGLQ
jgi:NADH-quinone oxidoreductase subunit M